MQSHAQSMLRRYQEFEAADMCFFTIVHASETGVSLRFEPHHPILKRPRLTIRCPLGTAVRDIYAEMKAQGWNEATCRIWWQKNGASMVRHAMLTVVCDD